MSADKDKIAGRVKQAAGDLTDNEDLKEEGDRQEEAGKIKEKIDDLADKAQSKIDDVKDALS